MKTFILTITIMLTGILGMQAQDISKHAIGLRLGDNDGLGAEISYQYAFKENNRLEVDLGWRSSNSLTAIKFTGLYQWVFNIDKGFNWYVGPGGGLGFWNVDNFLPGSDDSGSFFFIAGAIGVEYSFDFPLLISLDFRPEIGFGDFNDDLDFDIGLGVRYQF